MRKFFDALNEAIRSSEQSAVNFFSAVGPWLAPLAPAYSSYYHMTTKMEYPQWVALAIAIVVEILGLSAVSTIISFWSYNRRRMAEYKRAPVWIALMSFMFYLTIILTMNVMMDAAELIDMNGAEAWVQVIAGGMLTLLSVPAAVILAIRAQHRELLDELARQQEQKKVVVRQTQPKPAVSRHKQKKYEFFRDVTTGALAQRMNGNDLTAANVANLYGVSERNAFRWLAEMKEKGV